MMNVMTLSLVLFALAQLADICTTLAGLRQGQRERNPLIAWAMRSLGRYGWIAFKGVLAGGIGYLSWSLSLPVILWLGTAITAAVAVRNYRTVR